MKINFKVALNVFGEDVKDQSGEPVFLNKTLANLLGSNPHTETGMSYMDAMKWAELINKGEDVDLEKSEQELMKKFIDTNTSLTAFAKKNLSDCFVPSEAKLKKAV